MADRKLKAINVGDSSDVTAPKFRYVNRYDFTLDSLGNTLDSTLVGVDTIPEALDPLADKGPLYAIFSPNGASAQGLSYAPAVMGVVEKPNRDKLVEMLNKPEIKALFPVDLEFRLSGKPAKNYQTNETTNQYEVYAIKKDWVAMRLHWMVSELLELFSTRSSIRKYSSLIGYGQSWSQNLGRHDYQSCPRQQS